MMDVFIVLYFTILSKNPATGANSGLWENRADSRGAYLTFSFT